jgi:transglutaminase-like putative cysteine protease
MRKLEHDSSNWWDILTAVAFFLAMMTASSRLSATGWVQNLDLVSTVTMFGVFAGLALGKSIFSRPIVFMFGFVYGVFIVPWQLGMTLGVDIEWTVRLLAMVDRVRAIILDIILRDPITDNLFFLFLMATLFWILSVYTGFQLIRNGDVWRALLPGGIAIFTIHNNDPIIARRAWYLAAYIFLMLLVLARNFYLHEQRRWQSKRTFVPPDAGFDFSRFALLMTLIIVLMAWNSPALADSISPVSNLYQMIEKPWQNAKEEMSFLFASLRATVGLVSDFYSDVQPLGRGNVNADTDVMEIVAPRVEYTGQRFYWRARVYDFYQDAQWESTSAEQIDFSPANDNLSIPDTGEREIVEVSITPRNSLITLYSPTQPIWFSRPGGLNFNQLEDGFIDIVNMEARPFIRPGETYQVRSSIPAVTQFQLRDAGVDYPQWVLDRYLQVPEEITPRTRLLAARIAEGRETPYEVVNAMTVWLRENIEYVEIIAEPPSNQERIDWFLFEYQKGFCNYYSTAMVMMLRSVGIPARWAVGYAQGLVLDGRPVDMPEQLRGQIPEIFFEEEVTYNVRQLDAHAWPEIYFPGIGWVEFEPTVSQTPLIRPRGIDPNTSQDQLSDPFFSSENFDNLPIPEEFPDLMGSSTAVGQDESPGSSNFFVRIILILLGALIILSVLWFRRFPDRLKKLWVRVQASIKTPLPIYLEGGFKLLGFKPPALIRRMAFQAKLPPVAKSFLEVNFALSRLNAYPEPSATPTEKVLLLSNLLPIVSKESTLLLEQFHLETYSKNSVNVQLAVSAGESLRRLSIQNWFERTINKIVGLVQLRGGLRK